MAKLTDRTELTTPADGDLYVTTDVSDTTDAATGTDKKITWSSIKAGLKTYFDTLYAAALGADDNYVTDAEKTAIGTIGNKVTGPASATDNAIARFDGTTGKLIQKSLATVTDLGSVQTVGLNVTNPVDGTTATAVFNTNTTAQPVYITRIGGIDQALAISVNDTNVVFESIQDENTGSNGGFEFILDSGGSANPFFTVTDGTATLLSVRRSGQADFLNNLDAASVRAVAFSGDRATPAANDEIYQSFYLSDSAGNQDEFGRIAVQATDVTSTTEDSRLAFGTFSAGIFAYRALIEPASIRPGTGITMSLGTTGQGFSSVFITEGGAINWDSGDATLTQTGNTVELAGAAFKYPTAIGGVNAIGNLGATETIDWSTHTHYTGTLDSNITFTYSNQVSGQVVTLYLTYSGAQRTITWPTTTWLDNASGAAPTAPAASGNVLVVTLSYVGTTTFASATGNYAVYA